MSSAGSDPFLLITRDSVPYLHPTASDNTLSPISSRSNYISNPPPNPPITLQDHLRSFSRGWPLSILSLVDLALTTYFLSTYLLNSTLTDGPRQQLIYVIVMSYIRGGTLLVCSFSKNWRTKAAMSVSVGVGTGCIVVWVINWLVQAKSSEEGQARMWRRCLGAQVVFAFIDYISFNILSSISPLSPYHHIRPKPTLPNLATARRRQRATSLRYREEIIHSQDEVAAVTSSSSYGSTNNTNLLATSPSDYLLGQSPDTNEGAESIARFSQDDESDGSDSELSISSDEIIDIPPPRSPTLTTSTSRLNLNGGLRARGWSLNQVAVVDEERLQSVNDSELRRRSLQVPIEEQVESGDADVDEYPHPGEGRLERTLRKKWAQRARNLFGRGKKRRGSVGGEGVHVVHEEEETDEGRYGTFTS